MPAKKTSRTKSKPAPAKPAPATAAPATTVVSMKLPAALAGAARRRAARRRAEKKAAPPARSSRRQAKRASVTRIDWAKAARDLDRGEVKKVLDKGVSKADALLESAMTWVVKLAIRAKALYDMVAAWWHGKYDMPVGTLQAALVALLYFLSPLDIIPDVLPFFGLTDDAAVFAFVVHRIKKDLELYAEASGKSLADIGL